MWFSMRDVVRFPGWRKLLVFCGEGDGWLDGMVCCAAVGWVGQWKGMRVVCDRVRGSVVEWVGGRTRLAFSTRSALDTKKRSPCNLRLLATHFFQTTT